MKHTMQDAGFSPQASRRGDRMQDTAYKKKSIMYHVSCIMNHGAWNKKYKKMTSTVIFLYFL